MEEQFWHHPFQLQFFTQQKQNFASATELRGTGRPQDNDGTDLGSYCFYKVVFFWVVLEQVLTCYSLRLRTCLRLLIHLGRPEMEIFKPLKSTSQSTKLHIGFAFHDSSFLLNISWERGGNVWLGPNTERTRKSWALTEKLFRKRGKEWEHGSFNAHWILNMGYGLSAVGST